MYEGILCSVEERLREVLKGGYFSVWRGVFEPRGTWY